MLQELPNEKDWLDFADPDTDEAIYQELTVLQIVQLCLLWDSMRKKKVWVN